MKIAERLAGVAVASIGFIVTADVSTGALHFGEKKVRWGRDDLPVHLTHRKTVMAQIPIDTVEFSLYLQQLRGNSPGGLVQLRTRMSAEDFEFAIFLQQLHAHFAPGIILCGCGSRLSVDRLLEAL